MLLWRTMIVIMIKTKFFVQRLIDFFNKSRRINKFVLWLTKKKAFRRLCKRDKIKTFKKQFLVQAVLWKKGALFLTNYECDRTKKSSSWVVRVFINECSFVFISFSVYVCVCLTWLTFDNCAIKRLCKINYQIIKSTRAKKKKKKKTFRNNMYTMRRIKWLLVQCS